MEYQKRENDELQKETERLNSEKETETHTIEPIYIRNRKVVYFGSYPQTEVTDNEIINALGGFDQNTWTSYGYYIDGKVEHYMYYIDKEYNGNKYRGVYFTQYRPRYTILQNTFQKSWQYYNGYEINNVYWFKFEPIKWKVAAENDEYATLVAHLVLDSQEFCSSEAKEKTTREDYQGNTDTVHRNNYQYSTIRSWLNTTFYKTAFSELEKQIIPTVTVDNSASTTRYDLNKYACADTKDKVWLLSEKEALSYFRSYKIRKKQGSDYAKCQGLGVNYRHDHWGMSYWWLRSPIFCYNHIESMVSEDGRIHDIIIQSGVCIRDGGNVPASFVGVVPALKILL